MIIGHIADAHTGAFRDKKLKNYNLEAFKRALEYLKDRVDVLVIAGDLFHSPLPDLTITKQTINILLFIISPP